MKTEQLLAHHGWTLECESPLEIRHESSNSFASGYAAALIVDMLTGPESALQVYASASASAPPVAGWPLPDESFREYVGKDVIVTFTALVPLECLVAGDVDELNKHCQQAFGAAIGIADTEFRVLALEPENDHFDERFSGKVALQVTCTLQPNS